MLSAIIGFVRDGFAWAIQKFAFAPLKEIIDLRRGVQECLIMYGNLDKDAPADERHMAASTFRRLGVSLVSRHSDAWPWVRWTCDRLFCWDIHSAGEWLIGIGNGTQFTGFSWANNSPGVWLIRECLRLPVPKQSPLSRIMMAHAALPSSLEPDHF